MQFGEIHLAEEAAGVGGGGEGCGVEVSDPRCLYQPAPLQAGDGAL